MSLLSRLKISWNLIIIIAALAILAEVSWAVWTITEPMVSVDSQVTVQKKAQKNTLSLKASKTTWRVGEQFPVTVNMDSSKLTDGADIILIYDPKFLSPVKDSTTKVPLKAGTIYSDYPYNSVDEKAGRITVSGITSRTGGIIPQGVFGTITFLAKAPGQTKISFDFTFGKTTDSNVIETKTARDVLEEVQNLDVTVTP